jgi:hypothetical protein
MKLTTKSFQDIIHPDDLAASVARLEQCPTARSTSMTRRISVT